MVLCNLILIVALCAVCLSGSRLVKIYFYRNMVQGASTVLSVWLATLHKDRFIERQPGTTAQPQDWNGTILAY
jgi:hypothetical protein